MNVKQSMKELNDAGTEDYLPNTSINGPSMRGNSSFTVPSSVQNGDDAAIVKSQKDVQSNRIVFAVLKLQA